MDNNLAAFLDMVGISELGAGLIAVSDRGYNVLVGSTAKVPLLFHDYSKHPHIYNHDFNSTAAGKYQFIFPTWEDLRVRLKLPDFSPESQDKGCAELIRERNALTDVQNGNIVSAIGKCSNIWASLPGNSYGQHQNKVDALLTAYKNSGGIIC